MFHNSFFLNVTCYDHIKNENSWSKIFSYFQMENSTLVRYILIWLCSTIVFADTNRSTKVDAAWIVCRALPNIPWHYLLLFGTSHKEVINQNLPNRGKVRLNRSEYSTSGVWRFDIPSRHLQCLPVCGCGEQMKLLSHHVDKKISLPVYPGGLRSWQQSESRQN